MNRPTRDQINMEIAHIISNRSTCNRKHVGAVVVKEGRIIATGYNGVPSGQSHCQFCTKKEEICNKVLHAEAGLISFCAKKGISLEDSILYVTLSPCAECAKLIINAGIKEVIFSELYRNDEGLRKLKSNEIKVKRI